SARRWGAPLGPPPTPPAAAAPAASEVGALMKPSGMCMCPPFRPAPVATGLHLWPVCNCKADVGQAQRRVGGTAPPGHSVARMNRRRGLLPALLLALLAALATGCSGAGGRQAARGTRPPPPARAGPTTTAAP